MIAPLGCAAQCSTGEAAAGPVPDAPPQVQAREGETAIDPVPLPPSGREDVISPSQALFQAALRAPIKGPAKAVLLVLAAHANDDGECWPSNATLTLECGYCERAVRLGLVGLEAAGLVQRQARPGRATVYRLDPQALADASPPTPDAPRHVVPPAPDAPRHHMPPGTTCPTGGAPGAPTPAPHAPPGGHQVPPELSVELSKELSVELRPATVETRAREPAEGTPVTMAPLHDVPPYQPPEPVGMIEEPPGWQDSEELAIDFGLKLGVQQQLGESFQHFKNRVAARRLVKHKRIKQAREREPGEEG